MLLEELKTGLRIEGLIPAEVVTVLAAQQHGTEAIELTYCGSPEIVEGFLCRLRLGLGFPDLVVDGR